MKAARVVDVLEAMLRGARSSSEQPGTRYLKARRPFLRMTMSENDQLNAAPSGILVP
jgi:hypothetical protein